MTAARVVLVALALLGAAPVSTRGAQGAQQAPAERANVAGEWTIYIELHQTAMFRGSFTQDGAKLVGIMGNETAEYPVTGTVEGTQMKFSWFIYEGGQKVVISITGKFDREALIGTATIGDLKDIEVSGQRTSKG